MGPDEGPWGTPSEFEKLAAEGGFGTWQARCQGAGPFAANQPHRPGVTAGLPEPESRGRRLQTQFVESGDITPGALSFGQALRQQEGL